MSTITRFRTFIRPHDRHPESSQREGAEGQVYVHSKDVPLSKFISSLRPGEGARIKWAFLYAEPRSRSNPHPIRNVYAAFKAIEKRKCVVVEWGSDRLLFSNKPDDRDEMFEKATEMLRRSGKALVGRKGGRPRIDFPPNDKVIMEAQWFHKNNKNPAERMAAIKKRLGYTPSIGKLRKMFGPLRGEQK